MPRKSYTYAERQQMKRDFYERPKNITFTQYAKDNGITKSTLSRIVRNEEENMDPARKRMRKSICNDVDHALLLWFQDKRCNNVPISGPILKTKADKLALGLGYNGWKCSDGWIQRWRKRNNVIFKTIAGESNLWT